MSEAKSVIRSKAPLRISFAGGGTDVPPYADERGGAVLSATIDEYAFCTISPRDDKEMHVRSLDFSRDESWKADGGLLCYDGNLDLVKAVLNHFEVTQGFDMFLHCDAPPGSGLGGSSTVMVSLIGAVSEWLSKAMSQYDIARLAYILEREELGFAGGRQDQYSAVFGGFNYMTFRKDEVIVTPLRIRGDVLNELHYHSLLCYTGKTRDSGNIIHDQQSGMRAGQNTDALDNAKRLTEETKDALMKGEIFRIGELLDESWQQKKRFTANITNARIDKIYETARRNGAIGGKISGAGGGGFMYFICRYDRRHIVAKELTKLGAEVVNFNFEKHGLQTWRYKA
ncbi:MAG TPA: kinase [Methanomassiliicoccales archaeon]|nr:kinase [Methanomassiliicoccales archaeon]